MKSVRPTDLQTLLNASRRQIAETGGIPHEEFWGAPPTASKPQTPPDKPSVRRPRRRA
jgi:hypothetical protein